MVIISGKLTIKWMKFSKDSRMNLVWWRRTGQKMLSGSYAKHKYWQFRMFRKENLVFSFLILQCDWLFMKVSLIFTDFCGALVLVQPVLSSKAQEKWKLESGGGFHQVSVEHIISASVRWPMLSIQGYLCHVHTRTVSELFFYRS